MNILFILQEAFGFAKTFRHSEGFGVRPWVQSPPNTFEKSAVFLSYNARFLERARAFVVKAAEIR